MNSNQLETKKIKKKIPKRDSEEASDFICGACLNAYRSYSALYLHIKRKHDGSRPPGTKTRKQTRKALDFDCKSGRPRKSEKNMDHLDETIECLEAAQNNLVRLLGEELVATSNLSPKLPIEVIVQKITGFCENKDDKWLKELEENSKAFLSDYVEKNPKIKILDFEEDFVHLDPSQGLKVIVWFMLWLGNLYVKSEFIPELCLIFSKIWKVMFQIELRVQDLDNKMVWRKITQECEAIMTDLPLFKNNLVFLNDFIKYVCQIIGKTYEENIN